VSVITDIADAVVAELNVAAAALIPGGFVAERHYRPVVDLRDLADLKVTVVPRGIVITPANRAGNQHDVQIDVAVQQKVNDADQASLDALMTLVERIGQFFSRRRLSGLPGAGAGAAVWTKTENKPIYSAEHLEQFRTFTSVVTFTFKWAAAPGNTP
jgi:hypothetical protein